MKSSPTLNTSNILNPYLNNSETNTLEGTIKYNPDRKEFKIIWDSIPFLYRIVPPMKKSYGPYQNKELEILVLNVIQLKWELVRNAQESFTVPNANSYRERYEQNCFTFDDACNFFYRDILKLGETYPNRPVYNEIKKTESLFTKKITLIESLSEYLLKVNEIECS